MPADQPVLAIALMAAAAYFTRIIGFFLMAFVPMTPRVEAWISALPLSVMGAVLAPVMFASGPAEIAGFVVTFAAFRLTRSEIGSALAGVATAALGRWLFG